MKIQIENGPLVSLTKANFLSAGGEGEVYVKGNEAYKIFSDANKMLPLAKIKELGTISNPNVIVPRKLVLHEKTHKPIGYAMSYVKDTYSLVQLFTKAFREREGITHEMMQDLVKNFKELIQSIHQGNIIVVDLNEMNFLVNKAFTTIYGIDTDSYQTPSFPATAIMESIRDRHSNKFDRNTDWFSFAVLTFQMFIGIHPFKGKHNIKNIDERMLKNISVLNKDVKIPHVCYPLSVVPKTYLNWYEAVFENGRRCPPPDSFEPVVIDLSTRIISGTDNFNITEIGSFVGDILDVQYYNINRVLTTKHFYSSSFKKSDVDNNYRLGWFPKSKEAVLAKLINNKLKLINTTNGLEITNQITGTDMMTYNGSMYVKSGDHLVYVDIMELKSNTIVSPKIVANILPQASTLYDGVVVQNLLGAVYVSFFPEPTKHQQIHIKELDGSRIVDAKYDSNVFIAQTLKNGKYKKAIVRFDNDKYEVIFGSEEITPKPVNFIVIDKGAYGVVISVEDDEVHAFLNTKDNNVRKVISDPVIGGDMKLFKSGSKAVFARGNQLFTLEMKK